jgi:hypothetical protein
LLHFSRRLRLRAREVSLRVGAAGCQVSSCSPLLVRGNSGYSVWSEKLLSRGSCASLAREAARAISGPPGGGKLTSGLQRSLARFARQIFRSETVHVVFRMVFEVSGFGSLEIGFVQVGGHFAALFEENPNPGSGCFASRLVLSGCQASSCSPLHVAGMPKPPSPTSPSTVNVFHNGVP